MRCEFFLDLMKTSEFWFWIRIFSYLTQRYKRRISFFHILQLYFCRYKFLFQYTMLLCFWTKFSIQISLVSMKYCLFEYLRIETIIPRDTAFIAVVRILERRAVLKRARPNRFSLVPLLTIELHVWLLEFLAETILPSFFQWTVFRIICPPWMDWICNKGFTLFDR